MMNSVLRLIAQSTDSDSASFFDNPLIWFVGGTVLIAAVAIFLGNFIAKSFRSADHGWKISLIFGTVIAATVLVSILELKLGVDLKGGVTIIGELNEQEQADADSRITVKDIIPKLMERIDPSGTREITIRALDDTRMEVIIPDVDKPEADRIWERLTQTGQLLFRIVVDGDHSNVKSAAEAMINRNDLADIVREPTTDGQQGEIIGRWYKIARMRDEATGQIMPNAPFKFIPNSANLVRSSTGEVVNIGRPLDEISKRVNFQRDPNADFKAGTILSKWAEARGYPELEVLMIEPPSEDDDYNVEGKHLKNAKKTTDSRGSMAIGFDMKKEGTKRMMRLTTRNRTKHMAIILEGKIHTAPTINSTISSSGIIEGKFTDQEVTDLITTLNSGKIDVAMNKNPISIDFVESTLGKELMQKGLYAIGVSFVLVIIFMIVYYRFAGILACLALLLNLLFLIAIVKLIKQPLTLTGLAGIVLTVGMSVDANVLIFERIREELARGASLRMAIRNGFDRATTTIVDANLTTLITALVLYVIGTEQIKGFSITLIIGILMSMFTAIFCSRVAFELGERRGFISKLGMMKMLTKSNWDFIGKRGVAAVVSVIVILVGISCVIYRGGSMLDHDLRGGSTARVVFQEGAKVVVDKKEVDATVESIRDALNAYEYTFNDNEKITFTVAALRENSGAETSGGLRVKIDSNLPIQEDEEGEKLKTIEEIVLELFGDQLERPAVGFSAPVVSENNSSGSGGSNSGAAGKTGSLDYKDRFFLNSLNLTTMSAVTAVPQEGDSKAGKQDDKKGEKQEDKKSDTKTGSDKKTETKTGGDDKKTETPAPNTQDPNTQDPNTQDPNTQDPNTQDPNTQDPTNETPNTGPRQLYDASSVLSYKFAVSRDNLTSGLVKAAADNGIVILPRNVEAKALDTGDAKDDGSEKFRAKKWEVTLSQLVRKEDAANALAAYKTEIESQPYLPTVAGVGGQIAARTQWQALAAIVASLIGIIAYVWIRFQNIAFGLAAVVALIHDVLVVLGAIAVSFFLADYLGFILIDNFKISLPVVAAFLTIIGYSLNDTIVVFDRIREVRGKRTELTAEMINQSISQTLSRTILTSITTFIVVFILFAAGGQAIHGFAFALVVGVIVGTYSSIFVASPVLLFLMKHTGGPSNVDQAGKAAAKA